MKTLILASGEGTRMRPLTETTPKGMLMVGPKPVLGHIVDHLVQYGYDDIVMAVGYLEEQVREHFQDGAGYNAQINYCSGKGIPGTAGEIHKARTFLAGQDDFLLYYGDTLTGINLNVMEEFHRYNQALITTPVIRGIPVETSVVYAGDDGQVRLFQEKPVLPELANIPLFFVSGQVLDHRNIHPDRDFSGDVLADLVMGGRVFAYDESEKYPFIDYSVHRIDPLGNFHYDVGTISRYKKICEAYEGGTVGEIQLIK